MSLSKVLGCVCQSCREADNPFGDGFDVVEEKNKKLSPSVLRSLPTSSTERKDFPLATGVIDYFPLALAEVAKISVAGNAQHAPGEPLHWVRTKSRDHANCLLRHLIERGDLDSDGQRHTAKVAWRALAMLQEELEVEAGFIIGGEK